MALKLTCPGCREPLTVSQEQIAGGAIRCPSCAHVIRVKPKTAAPAATFEPTAAEDSLVFDHNAKPSVGKTSAGKTTSPARKSYDDDESPRSRSSSKSSRPSKPAGKSNAMIWWIVGGAGAGLALIAIAVVLVFALGGSTPAQKTVAKNKNAAPENPKGKKPVVEKPPVEEPVVPVAVVSKDPLTGEQIYQNLLKSTVYIESKVTRLVKIGGPAPIPKGPVGGGGGLVGTVWEGSETLQGFGKLRFEFTTTNVVTMIDAKDTSQGTWKRDGPNISFDFGGCTYTGTFNEDVTAINGTARNPTGPPWNWSVKRSNAKAGPGPGPGGIKEITAVMSGTGVFIDPELKLIVTNVHVVGPSETVDLFFPTFDGNGDVKTNRNQYSEAIQGRVVHREPRADIALVQLTRLPPNARPVALAANKAKPGQQVHSVGNPGASKAMWIYSPGKVRQVYADKWQIADVSMGVINSYDAMKLETDSPINPGDSGGPLVNDRCQLVAIAHGQNLAANNLSYFIDASEVQGVMQRYYLDLGKTWPAPRE